MRRMLILLMAMGVILSSCASTEKPYVPEPEKGVLEVSIKNAPAEADRFYCIVTDSEGERMLSGFLPIDKAYTLMSMEKGLCLIQCTFYSSQNGNYTKLFSDSEVAVVKEGEIMQVSIDCREDSSI